MWNSLWPSKVSLLWWHYMSSQNQAQTDVCGTKKLKDFVLQSFVVHRLRKSWRDRRGPDKCKGLFTYCMVPNWLARWFFLARFRCRFRGLTDARKRFPCKIIFQFLWNIWSCNELEFAICNSKRQMSSYLSYKLGWRVIACRKQSKLQDL